MISMHVRQYDPSVYFNSVMSNKRKCSFLVVLLTALFSHRGNAQRVNYQTGPFEFQAGDEYSAYKPFPSEYPKSFGNLDKNRPPSESSNTGLSFPTDDNQNGFRRDSGFGIFGRDENDRRAWNREENTHNQRGNGRNWSQNGEKSQGFGSLPTRQQSKKNWGNVDNPKRGSGFQNAGSGNQVNGNSFSDFGPNPKKTNGFNTNSGWGSGNQKENSGNREYQASPGKKKPGDNWNSGFNSGKNQGAGQTGASSWKPEDPKGLLNQFNPFQTVKPGSSAAGSNNWNPFPKPDKVNLLKPPKRPESDKVSAQKPSGSSSPDAKPGAKEQVDWTNLEKENKKGPLTVDLSQLWYPSDGKNPNQNGVRSKKRNVSTEHRSNCYCTDYDECDPNGRVDVSHVFGSDNSHLRSVIADCARDNKICCLTRMRSTRRKSHESDRYEIQGTNQRPTCGKRTSKRIPNDETEEGLANYGDFPWMLRLIAANEDGEGEETLCSASLIHSSVALTTASCALLLSGENIRVRAGEWNEGTGHERNKIQEAKIGKIFLHPDFDFVSYANDFALIFLDQAFDADLGTNSICLPSPNDAWDTSRCVVSGWFTENLQGADKPLLLKADLTDVIRGKCRNTSEYTVYNDAGVEDTRYICAHARSGDPCVASAGALMCPLYNSDMLVQVGFLSQSGTCNEFYKTGTFIDVMESIDWITHMEGIYLYFRNKQLQQ